MQGLVSGDVRTGSEDLEVIGSRVGLQAHLPNDGLAQQGHPRRNGGDFINVADLVALVVDYLDPHCTKGRTQRVTVWESTKSEQK